jgi:hypothetical protein
MALLHRRPSYELPYEKPANPQRLRQQATRPHTLSKSKHKPSPPLPRFSRTRNILRAGDR